MVNTEQLPASFTAEDMTALDRAILNCAMGPQKVRFADGRELTNRTADELIAIRRYAQAQIQQSRRTGGIFARATRATFVRD